MNKKEFLEALKQSLDGEVSSDIIEQNVRYYDQYIGSKSNEEEATILEELGNPRLIAKTIIETDKVAKQKGKFNGYKGNSYEYYSEEDDAETKHERSDYGSNRINTKQTWIHKITLVLIMMAVIFGLFFIGRLIIGFLFAFAVPIILVLLLMALFKKRN